MSEKLTKEVEYTEVGVQKDETSSTLKEGWVNVYMTGNGDAEVYNFIYPTEEKAKFYACVCRGYIDTVKIKWRV